jgi:TPP-dependent pyruvate/acetoin dehydrogenase alpha subunit
MAMEFAVRDIYYFDERNEGLCEKCREMIYKDPVKMIRLWLLAKAQIMVVSSKQKTKKEKKKWEDAIKVIEKREAELEKTPEVKALYKKNLAEIEEAEKNENIQGVSK